MAHTLPQLPYAYDALEPYIDAKTMEIHHSKHHQTYTDKFNTALEKHPELFEKTPQDLLKDLSQLPEDIRQAVVNHGGGYINHNLFWEILRPGQEDNAPQGALLEAINKSFTSFEAFKTAFTTEASTKFGSGWTWLCVAHTNEATKPKKLVILSTSNQDSPLSQGLTPIMTIDVWEHAYYLKHQNRRPEYIENFWKVANWAKAEELLKQA
ncbi:superoxide dismutase [Candidatus Peregrinibacteria bacterium CG_4_10_14_0_2_um_filter_38_24]|nr:MAG: superoxide dismutase [Candidatus Peregrinibacteria bacterium CG_4_10_14_0_2_um_filter_38_24]PJC38534.1 MAG: superoxide dismutase [Candidatus Peregrinibacteria bacterium CG_4_9_14_0_2_um_filter_38_9]